MKVLISLLKFAAISIFLQFYLGLTEAGIECQPNGVCRDISRSTPESTVCSKKCYSCTYKKCCNKVYTSQYAKCSINGWRKKGYIGNVPVEIGATKKRDVYCSKSNPCAKEGYKCVAYKKGDDKGFCWKEKVEKGPPSSFALAIAIAGLVILL
ncbi:hypothetical protein niasHT_036417 [Heterodera trifolii]|uniref:Uncharacterized protein n=1 Tax=Heterodera trifolii TaxID=157864 RepID=A0ABD2HXI7_9BILA